MTYLEVQEFLFSQLPMYQREGTTAFKKNLDNIIRLCDLLDNPQKKFVSIHIAGTNGKGSVSHMIAAGLQTHGLKVGMYTSPHYKDYRERIKINGSFIPEKDVIEFVEHRQKEFLKIQPSFFEITVAMAFDYFAKQKIDVAVIETGLGGRLDSTNIITPILSVITNISMDHQAMLGHTLPAIAGEKAGIIKKDIPVVIGEYQEEVFSVFEQKADEMNAPLSVAEHHIDFHQHENSLSFSLDDAWTISFNTHFSSAYQIKNYKTSIYALYLLKDRFSLNTSKISAGLQDMSRLTYYIGRWMKVQDTPRVFLDSAHNEAGVTELVNELSKLHYKKLHIVWGTAADKDISKILSLLPTNATYYFAKADIPRGMDASILCNIAHDSGLAGYAYASVPAAYRVAVASAAHDDIVVVAGSIFVVAEVV